jgi:hypothetical protein
MAALNRVWAMREDENCRRERHCDRETILSVCNACCSDDEVMQEAREFVTELCIRGGMMESKKNERIKRDGQKGVLYINHAYETMSDEMN